MICRREACRSRAVHHVGGSCSPAPPRPKRPKPPPLPAPPPHEPYRVVAISLYKSDLELADALVARARESGITTASRSLLIRVALAQLDLDAVHNQLVRERLAYRARRSPAARRAA